MFLDHIYYFRYTTHKRDFFQIYFGDPKNVELLRGIYAIRPSEGQDFLHRIVDNAVTMQRIHRIVYRFRHPLTYFPIELERTFVKTRI